MSEKTDSTGKYRLRSLEEILAPYADPETWREQLDDVQNPELRAVFEERLASLEGAAPQSPEASIKRMLAPLDSAEMIGVRAEDTKTPPASFQPYTEEEILFCAKVIARALAVREIWLFGSIARGEADEDSDVDLLVVLPDDHGRERPTYDATLALMKSAIAIPVEVVTITESQKQAPTSPLIEDALREGRRLL